MRRYNKIEDVPRVRFNLKPKTDKNGESLIIAVFNYYSGDHQSRLVYSTRYKISPKHWDRKAQLPRTTHGAYWDRKQKLDSIAQAIRESCLKLDGPSKDQLKDEVDFRLNRKSDSHNPDDLLSFFKMYIEERKEEPNAKKNTWQKYNTTYGHLKKFAKDNYNNRIEFNQVDFDFRRNLQAFLYAKPRNHSINHVSKIFSNIKTVMYNARVRGFHDSTTYEQRGFSVSAVPTKKAVLSFEELKKLSELDLSENQRLERVRDLFLIGAYSGLRVSDFTRIKPEHIIEDQGVEMINLFTAKTGTEVAIPLLPELKELLEKYNYTSPEPISDQRMNEYIKEVCELAGLDRPFVYKHTTAGKVQEDSKPLWQLISSHSARRSFATNFYEMGLPIYILRSITGHSSDRMFLSYCNVDVKKAARTMASLVANIMKEREKENTNENELIEDQQE